MIQLPYFDAILEACRRQDGDVLRSFGKNVHWGYWERPEQATGTVEDFAQASDAMTRKVCDAAGAGDGLAWLDTGCGFGGTVDSLNRRFGQLRLTGLNIDPRQLERARAEVRPRAGNAIDFVQGDACRLPFGDASFDVVSAVECIFHFPSRARFLAEARRVLKPGGRLVVSDYVAPGLTYPLLALPSLLRQRAVQGFYGHSAPPATPSRYRALGLRAGFAPPVVTDISTNVMPTYPFILSLLPRLPIGQESSAQATRFMESMSRRRWMRYQILAYTTA